MSDQTCPRCGNLNQYFHKECYRCGWDLSKEYDPETDPPYDGVPLWERDGEKSSVEHVEKNKPALASALMGVVWFFIVCAVISIICVFKTFSEVDGGLLPVVYSFVIAVSTAFVCVVLCSIRYVVIRVDGTEKKIDALSKKL